jgi:predicted RNA binding protein YcfA (HicA-like mRNA interferase family)
MSKRDKLRRKLRNNPKGVRFTDLETLLHQFGFTLARIKGSHHFFRYQHGGIYVIMVVPVHGNMVKPHYVKDSIELLDELFPEEIGSVEDDDDSG